MLKQREGEYQEVWGDTDKAAFQTFPVAENSILGDILVKSQKNKTLLGANPVELQASLYLEAKHLHTAKQQRGEV